jgi:predicted MFS family arabinose efflux permease
VRMDLEPLVAEAHAEALQLEADEPEPSPAERLAASRRRLRRRAFADAVLLLAAVIVLPLLFEDAEHAILAGIATAGAALVIFLARRDQDMNEAAQAAAAARHALDGRGISLADWHGGMALDPWSERNRPRSR